MKKLQKNADAAALPPHRPLPAQVVTVAFALQAEQVAEAEFSEEARGSPVVNQALDFLAKVSDLG